jgi:hypothetical protein
VTNPANGCTNSGTVYLYANNNTPFTYAGEDKSLNCFFTSLLLNGSFSVNGSIYTYSWTTADGNIVLGANTLMPKVDAPGTYVLKIVNTQNGCIGKDSAVVVQLPPVTASISATTPVFCSGGSTGSVTVSPGGGTENYTYKWTTGAQTAKITGLNAGTYTVTVTDSDGCTATASAVVTELVLLANATATPQTLVGVNNGTATVVAGGGTAPYTVKWSNNQTTTTIQNLAPGQYMVTVTDAHGCTLVKSTNVNAANCALSATVSSANVTCFGASNGSATINLTGGLTPATYFWSNGATTQSATGLSTGAFTVTATDAGGCTTVQTVQITSPTLLTAAFSDQQNVTCVGSMNGVLTAGTMGGTPPYSFHWSTGASSTTISGLGAGGYTLTITDSKTCTTTLSAIVTGPDPVLVSPTSQHDVTCANAQDGILSVNATGGTPPFVYHWSNNINTATNAGLAPGNYVVTSTDSRGCTGTFSATIGSPPSINIAVSSKTDVLCPAGSEGQITISASGGTQPLVFGWSNGKNTTAISGLSTGIYTVTVTDANNCSKTISQTIVVSDHNPPVLSLKNAVIELDNIGSAVVTAAMFDNGSIDHECGIASWTINPTSFNCTQLGTQTVTLTATDGAGNTSTGTANVTVQDHIVPTMQCPANLTVGICNATVIYNQPQISDNCTFNPAHLVQTSGLPSGSIFPTGNTQMSFTYADNAGNSVQCSFHVVVGEPLTTSITSQPATCAAACDGTSTLTVSSAAFPYNLLWSNSQTGLSAENLCPGGYSVTITDKYGCSQVQSVNITVFDNVAPQMTCPANITESACHSTQTFALPSVTDNCPVDPAQIQMLSGLPSGSTFPLGITVQTFSYADGFGNSTQCSFTVTILSIVTVGVSVENVHCATICDGSASLTLNGGDGPFFIQWSNGQTGVKASELCAGTYTATITDASGCSQSTTTYVTEPSPLALTVDQKVDDTDGAGSGSIQISVSGGVPSYHYLWTRNGQVFGNTKNLNHLTQGLYAVTITDGNGCTLVGPVISLGNTTSISVLPWETGMAMQPNPASESVRLILSAPAGEQILIQVCNLAGKIVKTARMSSSDVTIDLDVADLPVGMWMVSIVPASGNGTVRKLVISR